MNHFEFGILVASLRSDLQWIQKDLAKKSDMDISVISNIERGEKKLFTNDILIKLAEGLRLTSMERMEFIFAASGVTETEKFRMNKGAPKQQFDAKMFLNEAGKQIARIKIPVLITDQFCDIVLVNYSLIEFYGLPVELVQTADTLICGYNTMRYIFDPQSNFPRVFGVDSYEKQAMLNVCYFRKRTMRVRSKPFFSKLLGELLDAEKFPSFERCWRKVLFEEYDAYSTSFGREYPNSEFSFAMNESLFALTPYGELYMHQILPTSRQTAERIHTISKNVGEGYQQFAAFPDKRKL